MSRFAVFAPPQKSDNKQSLYRTNTDPPATKILSDNQGQKISHCGNTFSFNAAEGNMRVSDTLRPRLVNDVGLQRALKQSKLKKHPEYLSSADNVKKEKERIEVVEKQYSAGPVMHQSSQRSGYLHQNDNSINNNNNNNSNYHIFDTGAFATGGGGVDHNNYSEINYKNGHEHRAQKWNNGKLFGRESPRISQQPKVDVVTAFGRLSVGSGGKNSVENSRKSLLANNLSISPPRQEKVNTNIDERSEAAIEVATTSPYVHAQQRSTESYTHNRVSNQQTQLENKNESITPGDKSGVVHGSVNLSTIRRSGSGIYEEEKYQNPNAVAERILYALLQQNEELTAVANIQTSKVLAEEGLNGVGVQENKETSVPASVATQSTIALRISPKEARFLLGLINEKDQEILQLRCSLALSYRCAAYAIHRQYRQKARGSSSSLLSTAELRFLEAVVGVVNDTDKEAVLLLNRAPPHVQGIPNVPVPLFLPRSVCHVCGVLSMLNVEDILQKKMSLRMFTRAWHSYFVVADDRGLAVFRSEEDYKEHAFQRTLLVVPFKDMEYFVPSFRNLATCIDELVTSTDTTIGVGGKEQREYSNGFFFSSCFGKTKKSKKVDSGRLQTSGDTSEKVSVFSESVNFLNDDSKVPQHTGRRQLDRYDELMARIVQQYAGDAVHAYFGFIPKQPNTAAGGKIVNPPIIFRTKSTQEHVEWAHYFAQCFNKKLYREMFPSALAETYMGKESRETQTVLDTIETTTPKFVKKHEEKAVQFTGDTIPAVTRSSCVNVATQTVLLWQQNGSVFITEEMGKQKEEMNEEEVPLVATAPPSLEEQQPQLQLQPRPPLSAPPKCSVILCEEAVTNSSNLEELPHVSNEAKIENCTVVDEEVKKNEDDVHNGVPWKELVTELRELLATKNVEREELQRECKELRDHVQQLLRAPQQFAVERDSLLSEVRKARTDYETTSKRLLEIEHDLHAAREAARAAEDVAKEQDFSMKKLREELTHLRHERDLLVAELLAVKEGYSDGIRSLAKKAVGDIEQLHDVYSAQEYLCALRDSVTFASKHGGKSGAADAVSDEETSCTSSDGTLSLRRGGRQPPRAPPPATSLRQLPHCQSATNTEEPVGVAMLLLSFAPQHVAIDGCFTVDESQARLLQSGPLSTKQGRKWVILHQDTGAIFAITAELQTEEIESRSVVGTKEVTPRGALLRRGVSSVSAASPVSFSRERKLRGIASCAAGFKTRASGLHHWK